MGHTPSAPDHLYLVGAPDLGPAAWLMPERVEPDPSGNPPAHIAAAIGRGQSTEMVPYVRADLVEELVRKRFYALLLERAIRNAKSLKSWNNS